MHAVVEGQEIDDECFDLLQRTDSLKPNNEFKQWLHIWNISEADSRDAGHVNGHTSLPWIALWDKPDLSLIKATYHITDFVNFPTSWLQLWYHIEEMIEDRRTDRAQTHGPYWTLMEKPTIAFLAGKMAEMKKRIGVETFNANPAAYINNAKLWTQEGRQQFRHALEPFRVLTHQQEIEDETVRAAEERGHDLRVRNRPALGRPPRCR